MAKRIDSASRFIAAPPSAVFAAFSEPGALAQWMPPANMSATVSHFDFREGGSYRMRLRYADPGTAHGKTSDDTDDVNVRFVELDSPKRIDQEVSFRSRDPAFSGIMRMIWNFEAVDGGTLVSIRAKDVPQGISAEDHETGMNSTLENLARFLRGKVKQDSQ